MRTRSFVRAIPSTPVTVAFEESGVPFAYGAVANISEGGACVWTGTQFGVGQKVTVSLSAARQPQPLKAPAVVVWGEGNSPEDRESYRFGLRWVEPTPVYRGQIRRMLSPSH